MTATTQLIAEFTNGSKTREPRLTICELANNRRRFIRTMPVIDKRDARLMAKVAGATCWNF